MTGTAQKGQAEDDVRAQLATDATRLRAGVRSRDEE